MKLPWQKNARREIPSQGPSTYAHLRTLFLSGDPTALHLAPSEDLPNVWAVAVEMWAGAKLRGVASLIAIAEGSVSLYTSTGGGTIGGGQHKSVREAGHQLLITAEGCLGSLGVHESLALPPEGQIGFIILTYGGKLGATVDEAEIQAGGHPLSPLYSAAQDVILQLRVVSAG